MDYGTMVDSLVHDGLVTMGRGGCSGARVVVVIAQKERERERVGCRDSSERERRSSGFSLMTPLGGGTVEMTTRQRSMEATGGASIGR
jgi:hypothetical protein